MWTERHLRWQLFMQAAPVNLFQQWIKWIWKPSISITQSSVQHVLLYIICVRNKFSLFFWYLCARASDFIVSDVHTYVNKNVDLGDQCVPCACAVCVHVSVRVVGLLCMQAPGLYLPLCVLLHAPMSIYKRWNEDRKSNQCCRCLRAYRFPFFFSLSPLWKNKERHLSQWADCRGHLRRRYCRISWH